MWRWECVKVTTNGDSLWLPERATSHFWALDIPGLLQGTPVLVRLKPLTWLCRAGQEKGRTDSGKDRYCLLLLRQASPGRFRERDVEVLVKGGGL